MSTGARSVAGKRADQRDHPAVDGRATSKSEMHSKHTRGMYLRFGGMIATAMAAMFLLTYVNTYALDHVRWSETRFYMTFVMGAVMAVIMLGFMRGMYTNRVANVGIVAGSALVFILAIWLVRSQATVEDRSYMRAMIPHHSIAILTSERANLDDIRVRELADEIITSQQREIAEMNWLIDDIGENGLARTESDATARLVPDFGRETPPRRFKSGR
jgi:membrane-associated HD superfamily phosphohydrolase